MGKFLKVLGIGFAVLIVLCVIGAILAPRTPSSNTASQSPSPQSRDAGASPAPEEDEAPSATSPPEPTAAPTSLPKIGDDVRVADARWKVLEASDMGNTLKAQYLKDLTTPGKYVFVLVEVENLGKEAAPYDGVEIVDGQGRTFKHDSDTIMYLPEGKGKACVFETLNPNVPMQCAAIFALPADAAGLQLSVGDLSPFGGDSALISLQ